MNKLILGIISFTLITACCQKNEEAPASFTTDITGTNNNEKYANVPTTFTINFTQDNNYTSGKYLLRYSAESGKGELFIKDQKIQENKEKEFSDKELQVSYFPLTIGEHRLRFRMSRDGYETESVYAISVQDYSVSLSPSPIEETYVNQPVYIDFNLTQKNHPGDFSASIKIVKGAGNVFIVKSPETTKSLVSDTTIIIPVSANDTVSRIQTRSEESSQVKAGKNRLYFHPTSTGEHILRLSLVNNYGYEQTFDIKLQVITPEFSATAENDTCIILGKTGNFILYIKNPVQEEVYTTFHFLKNSGKVFISGNLIEENKVFSLLPGDHQGKYMPAATGNAAIQFLIKDQYNKTKKGLMEFNIVKSLINLELQKPSGAYIGEKIILKANINENNYSGTFRGKITTIPAKAGVLTVNSTPYSENMVFKNGENIIQLIPNQSGLIKLEVVITDETEISAEGSLELQVSEYEHDLKIDDYNPVINIGETGCISFDVVKPSSYTGKYYCEILQQPENAGKIKLNGKDYTAGKIAITTSGNQLMFTPESTGEISLNLSLYAENKKIQRTITFTSSNNDLDVDISGFKKNILAGQEANLSFSVSKKGYSGTFKYFITQNPAGTGSIRLNGTPYIGEEIETIKNNTSSSISYTPNQSGAVTLNIHVLDGLKETIYPLTYEVSNTPIFINIKDFNTTAFAGKENICQLSIEKADYIKEFTCEIKTQPENAGKIKVNNYLSDNNSWNITSGNHVLSFTPNKGVEDIVVNLFITDVYGERSNKTLEYHIKKSELTITPIGNIDASINKNEGGRFSLAVEKENYAGKYYLETNGKGYKNLKVSGQLYTEKSEIADPKNVSISFFPSGNEDVEIHLRVTDEEGETVEKSYLFKVNNSDLLLTLNGIPGTLYTGNESIFSFIPTKPSYTGILKYKIHMMPEDAGELYIAGIPYYPGDISEINAGATTHVVFKALKECTAEIKVTVTDKQSEKSKLFSCKIINTPVIINVTGFHSNSTINTENISYLSVPKNNYKGKYKLNITTEPNNAGVFRINNNIYEGGEVVLDQPDNTKITFIPRISGTIFTDLKITNEYGASSTQQLEYNITNPELQVTITELKELTVNKEAVLNFNVNKPNYTGNLYCEVKGDNINSLKINNTVQNEEKVKIFPGSNNIRFTPITSGKNAVSLHLVVTDDWGGEITKDLISDVNETNTEITLIAEKQELYEGEETSFIFTVNKETPEPIGYTLIVEPAQAGTVKPCEGEAKNGIPEHITFKAKNAGPAIVSVKAGNTEKKISFNIIKPQTDLSFQGFSPTSQVNISNKCNFNISRNGYSGTFTGRIQIKPENGGIIRIDGSAYKSEGIKLATGSHSLEFIPAISGEVTIIFQAEDDWGGEVTKDLVYQVSGSPEDLRVSINGNGKTINLNNEASFTFIPLKTGYSGKYYAELTGNNCRDFNINGTNYAPGQRIEILNTSNTVKFFPEVEGEINVQIKIIDANNNSVTDIAGFLCISSSSPIDLSLITGETSLVDGETSNFIFTPSGGQDLSYELSVKPVNAGKFIIKDKEYTGKTDIESGMSVNVTYIPQQTGSSEVVISITNPSGERKDKTIRFEVTELSLIIPEIAEWTNGEKVMAIGERSGMRLSSNSNLTCSITDINNQPVEKVLRANFYINGILKTDNIFTVGSTPVKLEIEPLQSGKHEYSLNAGIKKYNLLFNVPDKISIPKFTIDLPDEELIIGKEFCFNMSIRETGTYTGDYELAVYSSSNINTDIKVNGADYEWNKWHPVRLEEINKVKICAVPNNYGKATITLRLKDKGGKLTSETFELGSAKREYTEVPVECVLERQSTNPGTYYYRSDLQYHNNIEGDYKQVSIGLAELTLEPGNNNKQTQKLNPVRIFRSSTNEGWLEMTSNSTVIEWENSPAVKVNYYIDVLSANGGILAHYQIKNKEVLGNHSGNNKWVFASPFESSTFIQDWEQVKQPGVSVRVHYLLEDTEAAPTGDFIELPANFIMEREQTNNASYIFNCSLDYYNYSGEGKFQNTIGDVDLTLNAGSNINRLTQPLSKVRVYKINSDNGKLGGGLRSSLIEYKWNGKYPAQKAILSLKVMSENGDILAGKTEETVITQNTYWTISGSIWSDITIPWNAELSKCHVEISYRIKDIEE